MTRLFSRRRPESAALARWLPELYTPVPGPADTLGDPLAATARAHAAVFCRKDKPATLAIWAYARYSSWCGGFHVGFRIDRLRDDVPERDTDSEFYAPSQALYEWFGTAGEADRAAQVVAALLLGDPADEALSEYVDPTVAATWFAWNGELAR
jgi:hypothetical protein